ncbi:MAG: hypothetical protein LBI58_05040 [Tannerellaceae bacterium]|jgi:hypothetical protein|nr:hypothetical protein [Tannerellaceae bacterium]
MWYIISGICLLGLIAYLLSGIRTKSQYQSGKKPICDGGGGCEGCQSAPITTGKAVYADYYDDEELDRLAGIPSSEYTDADIVDISEVLGTLNARDVEGWLYSLERRRIELPGALRKEAHIISTSNKKNLSRKKKAKIGEQ